MSFFVLFVFLFVVIVLIFRLLKYRFISLDGCDFDDLISVFVHMFYMTRVSNQHGISCCPFQIVIPFFSLFIKDIYFLNEGCASRLPNGHINFEVSQICCRQLLMQEDWVILAYNQIITAYSVAFTSKL